MCVFALYLDAVGSDRLKVLLVLKQECNLAFVEGKAMLAQPRPRLRIGDKQDLKLTLRRLRECGAEASMEFYPEGLETTSWARSFSDDGVHCKHCRTRLFFSVPQITTRAAIVEFARSWKGPSAAVIEADGWIHPGVYCPNDCGFAMVNLGDTWVDDEDLTEAAAAERAIQSRKTAEEVAQFYSSFEFQLPLAMEETGRLLSTHVFEGEPFTSLSEGGEYASFTTKLLNGFHGFSVELIPLKEGVFSLEMIAPGGRPPDGVSKLPALSDVVQERLSRVPNLVMGYPRY